MALDLFNLVAPKFDKSPCVYLTVDLCCPIRYMAVSWRSDGWAD